MFQAFRRKAISPRTVMARGACSSDEERLRELSNVVLAQPLKPDNNAFSVPQGPRNNSQ